MVQTLQRCFFYGSYTPGSDLLFEENDSSGEDENVTALNRPIDSRTFVKLS